VTFPSHLPDLAGFSHLSLSQYPPDNMAPRQKSHVEAQKKFNISEKLVVNLQRWSEHDTARFQIPI
jgi:hypothetical protein